MAAVLLFRQTHCGACGAVERYLHDRGVGFVAKDVDTDPAAMAEFLTFGYLTTPLTVIDGTPVPGFQPKRLATLLATLASDPQRNP